jgi:hypothetical protein
MPLTICLYRGNRLRNHSMPSAESCRLSPSGVLIKRSGCLCSKSLKA